MSSTKEGKHASAHGYRGHTSKPMPIRHETHKTIEANDHTFTIHKDYICFYSPFFHAAFNGNFQESERQSMSLEDVDPALFGILVHWIYHQSFDLPKVESSTEERKVSSADYETLAKLWILAQRMLMPALQNHVMDVIVDSLSKPELWEGSNFARLMEIAGENDPTSALALLAINHMVYCRQSFFDAQVLAIPACLTLSVMKALKVYQTDRKLWFQGMGMGAKTTYHVKLH